MTGSAGRAVGDVGVALANEFVLPIRQQADKACLVVIRLNKAFLGALQPQTVKRTARNAL